MFKKNGSKCSTANLVTLLDTNLKFQPNHHANFVLDNIKTWFHSKSGLIPILLQSDAGALCSLAIRPGINLFAYYSNLVND